MFDHGQESVTPTWLELSRPISCGDARSNTEPTVAPAPPLG